MYSTNKKSSLVSSVIFLLLFITPGLALSQSDTSALKYLPADTKATFGVNIESMRSSQNFDSIKDFIKGQTPNSELLSQVRKKESDLIEGLKAFNMAFPEPPSKKKKDVEKYTLVMNGDFNKKDISTMMNRAEDKKSKNPEVKKQLENLTYYIPEKGVAVMISGPKAYRKKTKSQLDNGTNLTSNSTVTGILGKLDASPQIWFAGTDTKHQDRFQKMGIGISLKKGLSIRGFAECNTPKEAKSNAAKLRKMKKNLSANPMLAMFGAAPLVKNLAVEHSENEIQANSKMTSQEFGTLIQKLKAMLQQAGGMGQNSGSGMNSLPSTPAK